MTTFESVTSLTTPRVHQAKKREADLIREAASSADILVIELDGSRMRTVDGLFGEYALAFSFPAYFGWNWAAFHECLYDLRWLTARRYLTIVGQASEVLSDEPCDLQIYLNQLETLGRQWSTTVGLGYEWAHGEVPFHTILVE